MIFYKFLQILQGTAETLEYIYAETLNKIPEITNMPLVSDKHPRKIEEDAIGSLAGLETSPAVGSGRDRPGSTPRRREDLAWVDWKWGSGRRWRRRAPAAGWPSAGRRSSNPGPVQHNAGQGVEGEASLGRVGGVGVEGRLWFGAGSGVLRRRWLWRPAERSVRLADEKARTKGRGSALSDQ
jgi:hypothetical protein